MILICYGTRPEFIKIQPLITELKGNVSYKLLFTGQHTDIANFQYDYKLNVRPLQNRLDSIFSSCLDLDESIFSGIESVMVMGDTASAAAMTIAAFNRGLKILHLEAGLRTYDMNNPYPEEGYRQLISRLADVHFCPTKENKLNLEKEKAGGSKHVVGNTVLDNLSALKTSHSDEVIVTMHRRENHPLIADWFKELSKLALENSNLRFTIPLHPNPNVSKYKDYLIGLNIIEPLPYEEMKAKISNCRFIISDSGGLQEEASFLKKKIIVCRKTTERPESLGETSFLCSSPQELQKIFNRVNSDFTVKYTYNCPFGDGNASSKIANILR
mgnify:FL=1|tara:strand:- start:201 stop:1184 length:984 start_codon:yes stop_codon:yes gene_type:complete